MCIKSFPSIHLFPSTSPTHEIHFSYTGKEKDNNITKEKRRRKSSREEEA